MSEFGGLWKHKNHLLALVPPKTECGWPSGGGSKNDHIRYPSIGGTQKNKWACYKKKKNPVGVLDVPDMPESNEMTEQIDRRAKQPSQAGCVSEYNYDVLRSLRHYLRAPSQRHHTIDHLEDRGVDRRSAQRASLRGRKGVNIGTVSKATLGTLCTVSISMVPISFILMLPHTITWSL